MTSPVAPNNTSPSSFPQVIEQALTTWTEARNTAHYAISTGVNPHDLIDYVRGTLSEGERADVQAMLATSPWAMGRVVALVKAKRRPESLGTKIMLTEGKIDPAAWGIPSSGDHEVDLAKLLDTL